MSTPTFCGTSVVDWQRGLALGRARMADRAKRIAAYRARYERVRLSQVSRVNGAGMEAPSAGGGSPGSAHLLCEDQE